ncbi:hypothetical protein AcV5_002581 [Taiwanofungus camphoratus]|nr:hypothetical protein AcV5_002581 [Antrodia cinnamomea]
MFPIGFQAFLATLWSEQTATRVGLAVPIVATILWLWSLLTYREDREDVPVTLPQCPLFVIWPFFKSRFDFINEGFQLAGHSVYQFRLLRNTVIVMSGEPARRDFFLSKSLDLNAGFKVLSGAIPMLPGITSDLDNRRISLIHKRLATIQSSGRLSLLIPKILEDSRQILESWGTSGIFDPFERMSLVTFQTTVRSLASVEIAEDAAIVSRLKGLYDTLDAATTPTNVLLPWCPTPSAVKRLLTTKKIYDIVNGAIDARTQSGCARDDTLQLLLDNEDDRLVIIGFIMGLLVAGARSTGTTVSWLITFLGGHSDWKMKAATEVRQLVLQHSQSHSSPPYEPSPLSSLSGLLSSVPLEAWESRTPILDSVIRETLRIAQPHTAMRMNVGPEMRLAGKAIPPGAFVMYPFSDVHLSPELYPDPWKFDPSRLESKMPFSYVGWGGGGSSVHVKWKVANVLYSQRKDNVPRATASQIRAEAHHCAVRAWS